MDGCKKLTIICIWLNRFEYEMYREGDKIKTFGSYTAAWDFIYSHRLPLGASAVELYLPVKGE